MLKITAILIVVLASLSAHAECTKRPGASDLDFPQIMYHLGRVSRIGGMLAMKGMNDPFKVKDSDYQEAVTAIDIAKECVDLSINDTTGNLLPRKAATLTGVDRDAYLKLYTTHMNKYAVSMDELRAMICDAQLAPSDPQIWLDMHDKERELIDIANDAHSVFGKPNP